MRQTASMAHRTLNDTAAQVLSALMRLHDVTDTAAGEACGKDRTWIEARRNGRSKLKLDDLEQLAKGLQVPPTVFFMEPAEAIRYSLDNPTEQGIRSTIREIGTIEVQGTLDELLAEPGGVGDSELALAS